MVREQPERAEHEAGKAAGQLLTSAYILSGMHVHTAVSRAIFTKVLTMRESSTYMSILEEGTIEHMREVLLKLGTEKFGVPTERQARQLSRIDDLERLDRLALRLIKVDTWAALLKGR